jgi:hypothetical protein
MAGVPVLATALLASMLVLLVALLSFLGCIAFILVFFGALALVAVGFIAGGLVARRRGRRVVALLLVSRKQRRERT